MQTILLHTCCAPCLTSVEEKLSKQFELDIFWFNPQIFPTSEYERRLNELKQFTENKNLNLIDGSFDQISEDEKLWRETVIDYTHTPEGGRRCALCLRFRLEKTVLYAKANGYPAFTTTLTVSPHKNSKLITQIGLDLAEQYQVEYLPYDFKKDDGFLRSCKLSREYNLYRQNYCGCEFSYKEMLSRSKALKDSDFTQNEGKEVDPSNLWS